MSVCSAFSSRVSINPFVGVASGRCGGLLSSAYRFVHVAAVYYSRFFPQNSILHGLPQQIPLLALVLLHSDVLSVLLPEVISEVVYEVSCGCGKTSYMGHTPFRICSRVLGICMCIFASRWCADYACASYAVADEARVARITLAVGLGAVWC